jgi:hypothetical protein
MVGIFLDTTNHAGEGTTVKKVRCIHMHIYISCNILVGTYVYTGGQVASSFESEVFELIVKSRFPPHFLNSLKAIDF